MCTALSESFLNRLFLYNQGVEIQIELFKIVKYFMDLPSRFLVDALDLRVIDLEAYNMLNSNID